jgi:hypothetical protein
MMRALEPFPIAPTSDAETTELMEMSGQVSDLEVAGDGAQGV